MNLKIIKKLLINRRLLRSIVLGAVLVSQAHCGSDSDSVAEGDEQLKRRTTQNGKDQLLLLEEFFYEGNQNEPSRVEYSKPNAQGNLVVVKMRETSLEARRHAFLEVSFDPQTLEETQRETIVEDLEELGGELIVTKKETTTEKPGERTQEVILFSYTMVGGEAKLQRKKTVVDDVPVHIEEWKYDKQGRPVLNRLENGDRELRRTASYHWKDGSFAEKVYNEAGKEVESVSGEIVFRFDRVIRTEEKRVGTVLVTHTSCSMSGRQLSCSETMSDRISGDKTGQDHIEVALDGSDAIERPLEEKHERYENENRVLLVSDDWQYRPDHQVKLQLHGVDSANQAALVQFQEEFAELYDFRLSKEYNENDLPVKEYKQTKNPLDERLVSYEY